MSELNNILILNETKLNYSNYEFNLTEYDKNKNFNDSMTIIVNTWLNGGKIQIPLYTIIFLLSIIGNLLVISTLIQNYRMRTITNLFLLNLAISDILLGVFCMPFTLIGALLRDFVFGELLCKLIPFLQATSVAVSSWTLVAISCERYYAICHPLRSRSWQTIRHAYKIIGFIWLGSFTCMIPIAGFSQLIPTSQGSRNKCREQWPLNFLFAERAFNIFLDLILLVLPLMVLCAAYILITRTLWLGIRAERKFKQKSLSPSSEATTNTKKEKLYSVSLAISLKENYFRKNKAPIVKNEKDLNKYEENSFTRVYENNDIVQPGFLSRTKKLYPTRNNTSELLRTSSLKYFEKNLKSNGTNSHNIKVPKITDDELVPSPPTLRKQFDSVLRRSNVAQNLENKQRVIRMLFVLVLEFFLCWTPLYVINTITLFNPGIIYQNLGYTAISFFQLLAYSSSCCNPITYCFMNANFRRSFLDTFKGLKLPKKCEFQNTESPSTNCDKTEIK